jgi:Flp pilus assembly pilin Flp
MNIPNLTSGRLLSSAQLLTQKLHKLQQDESGQDTVEYTLLLAFVCLLAGAMFVSLGGSTATIWTSAENTIVKASTVAASGKGL